MTTRSALLVASHAPVARVSGQWITKNRIAGVLEDLSRLGWDVLLLARQTPPLAFLTVPVPADVRVLPITRSSGLRTWVHFARALHCCDAALVFMPTVRTALVACLVGRKAVVYAGHSWKALGALRWRAVLEELVARRASHLVAAGDDVEARFARYARAVTLATPLVPHEVAERLTHGPHESKDYSEVRVLFVGSIGQRKGVAELLRALETTPEVTACIVGPIDDDGLGLRVHDAARVGRLSFRPYVEWQELRELYLWANALVLPSHSEGFPRVAYEAAAFGNALVVTPVGGIPARLADGVSAVFVPPRNAHALSRALRTLAREPQHLERLAKAAREALAPTFARLGGGAQFDVLLREVIGNVRDKPGETA